MFNVEVEGEGVYRAIENRPVAKRWLAGIREAAKEISVKVDEAKRAFEGSGEKIAEVEKLTNRQKGILWHNLTDIQRLLAWKELPRCGGPLLAVVLNGISSISGMCYGYSAVKRSFVRFVTDNMQLALPFANLLYECKKHVGATTLWAEHFAMVVLTPDRTPIFSFLLHNHIPAINVVALAECFVTAVMAASAEGKLKHSPGSADPYIANEAIRFMEELAAGKKKT